MQALLTLLEQGEVAQILQCLFDQPHLLEQQHGPLSHTLIFYVLKVRDQHKRMQLLQELIQLKANLNAKDKAGQTPLFYAACNLTPKQCRLLLQAGANPNVKDMLGNDVLDYVKEWGKRTIHDLIMSYGGQPWMESGSSEKEGTKPKITHFGDYKYQYAPCHISATGKVSFITAEQARKLPKPVRQILHSIKTDSPKSSEVEIAENWQKCALKVIDQLYAQAQSFNFRRFCQVWRLKNEFQPDYPGIDLSLIRIKLLHHIYQQPRQLREDIKLIVANTRRRMGESHQATQMAVNMQNTFEKLSQKYNFTIYK